MSLNTIQQLLKSQKQALMKSDPSIVAFNVGVNAGEAAGQTVFHCHIHLIPRRKGDMENPRGGVRGVIPAKQKY
jgi:diadenosine tetraphosphate (Ap4A) HIT family hydrolase